MKKNCSKFLRIIATTLFYNSNSFSLHFVKGKYIFVRVNISLLYFLYLSVNSQNTLATRNALNKILWDYESVTSSVFEFSDSSIQLITNVFSLQKKIVCCSLNLFSSLSFTTMINQRLKTFEILK